MRTCGGAEVAAAAEMVVRGRNVIVIGRHQAVSAVGNQEKQSRRKQAGLGDSEKGKNVKVATFNIRNGRAGNVEVALRAIAQVNVDIAILTETELTDDRCIKYLHVHEVITTTAKYKAQGGVFLAYRDNETWQVEAVKRFGPNVVGFELVTGVMLIVGCTSQDGRPAKSARRSSREDEDMTHPYL
jgi:hypothetical protein